MTDVVGLYLNPPEKVLAELLEGRVQIAPAAPADLDHRRLQVVVHDACRHAAEKRERQAVTLQKELKRGARKAGHNPGITEGQRHHEHLGLERPARLDVILHP